MCIRDRENAVLKRKMKVLADKITEYQETEGAMRATLLTAQKMANQLVEEAKEKRAKMLEEAESIAREQADKLARQVAEEEAKLKDVYKRQQRRIFPLRPGGFEKKILRCAQDDREKELRMTGKRGSG